MEKRKTYGDVFAFWLGGKYTVVLNGYDVIREALLKKSADFAGRIESYTDGHVLNVKRAGLISKQYDEVYKRNQLICMTILKQYGYGDRNVMETRIHDQITELITEIKSTTSEAIDPREILETSTLNVIHDLLFGDIATRRSEVYSLFKSRYNRCGYTNSSRLSLCQISSSFQETIFRSKNSRKRCDQLLSKENTRQYE